MAFLKISRETQASILGDRLNLGILSTCIALIAIQVGLIFVSLPKLPPQIPLFYSRPWGETMLAPNIFIWILPLSNLIICTFNLNLAIFVFKASPLLFKTLFAVSLLVSIMLAYDVVKIITLLI